MPFWNPNHASGRVEIMHRATRSGAAVVSNSPRIKCPVGIYMMNIISCTLIHILTND